jgi:hypothetical protein
MPQAWQAYRAPHTIHIQAIGRLEGTDCSDGVAPHRTIDVSWVEASGFQGFLEFERGHIGSPPMNVAFDPD